MRGGLRGAGALAALGTLLLAGCRVDTSCAGDYCTSGTVQRAGPPDAAAWDVRGDDGTTYEVVPALPSTFQRDGLRVKLVARKHGSRKADGVRPVSVVRIETIQRGG